MTARMEYVSSAGIATHDSIIAHIAVVAWLQVSIDDAAYDAFVADECDIIAGPVVGIDMPGADVQQIAAEIAPFSIGRAGGAHLAERHDGPHEQDEEYER